MQNEAPSIIEVSHLTTSFYVDGGWKPAISNINFSISPNKTIALVGESGSGKSVSSLSITRLLPQETSKIESGDICFKEEIKLNRLSERELRHYRTNKISMIFQDPMSSLNPVERCGKQVLEALRLHMGITRANAKSRVLQLFKDVELPNPEVTYNKYPFELSGGQKQRVMIAMAMSCNPDLLIADEPTTALDPEVSRSILNLIKNLQKQTGMGILFITHDLDLLLNFADEVIVMYKGKIVERGATDQILNKPNHAYTRALIACKPPKNYKPKRLPTISDFMADENFKPEIETPEERQVFHQKIYSLKPLIQVKGLSVHFPIKDGVFRKVKSVTKAVDNISFDIFKGETLGLIGPSGCGKTTLGRALLKLVEPASGEIFYRGKDILKFKGNNIIDYRKEIQIIFQDPFSSLNPRMKVGEALTEPLIVHGQLKRKDAKEKVLSLLERVGLNADHYSRYPHEFSGGQRQRIGIARALALNPKVIVCDESVSALDVSVQAQVLNLLNDLKDEFELTYLFISHDMDVVRYFSDRVIVIQNGRIKSIGTSKEILE